MRTAVVFASLTALALGVSGAPLQPQTGSLCIAPAVLSEQGSGAPCCVCMSGRFSVKIDDRAVIEWSKTTSVSVKGLDVGSKHRVTVFCDGKRQQTFSFVFSEFKSTELCLFLNDLYRTVQLWDRKGAPWCKCKPGV